MAWFVHFRAAMSLWLVLLTVAACGSPWDYSLPEHAEMPSTAAPPDFGEVDKVATGYSNAFTKRAAELAESSQFTDLFAMGASGGAIINSLTHGVAEVTQILGVTAAGSLGVGSYYAPRQRALVYVKGAQAMNCIAGLASTANHYFSHASVKAFLNAAATPAGENEKLKPFVEFRDTGLQRLRLALAQIKAKVLSDTISASKMQDLAGFAQSLKDKITLGQLQKSSTGDAAKITIKKILSQNADLSAFRIKGSEKNAIEENPAIINEAIVFTSDFDTNLTVCENMVN
jgi:hypothetical protein